MILSVTICFGSRWPHLFGFPLKWDQHNSSAINPFADRIVLNTSRWNELKSIFIAAVIGRSGNINYEVFVLISHLHKQERKSCRNVLI